MLRSKLIAPATIVFALIFSRSIARSEVLPEHWMYDGRPHCGVPFLGITPHPVFTAMRQSLGRGVSKAKLTTKRLTSPLIQLPEKALLRVCNLEPTDIELLVKSTEHKGIVPTGSCLDLETDRLDAAYECPNESSATPQSCSSKIMFELDARENGAGKACQKMPKPTDIGVLFAVPVAQMPNRQSAALWAFPKNGVLLELPVVISHASADYKVCIKEHNGKLLVTDQQSRQTIDLASGCRIVRGNEIVVERTGVDSQLSGTYELYSLQ